MSEKYLTDLVEFKGVSPFLNFSIPIAIFTLPSFESVNKKLVSVIDTVEEFYLKNKNETISSNSDGFTNTQSILTHNYMNFNILDHTEYEEVLEFKTFISSCYKFYFSNFLNHSINDLYLQCWGNKVRRYDYLNKHAHFYDINTVIPTGNYFVKSSGHNTCTRYYSPISIYKNIAHNILNKEGQLTLFPPYIEHSTTSNRAQSNIRYTIGMDGYAEDDIERCLVKII